jgi:D-lactate dehydrogenase (cytochrome)
VSDIVKLCARNKVPIIPFGAGTGFEKQPRGVTGRGVYRYVANEPDSERQSGDLDATVDAGVTHEQLNEHLRDTGLFFSVDLGAKVHLADRTVSESVAKTQSLKFAPGTVELHLA